MDLESTEAEVGGLVALWAVTFDRVDLDAELVQQAEALLAFLGKRAAEVEVERLRRQQLPSD